MSLFFILHGWIPSGQTSYIGHVNCMSKIFNGDFKEMRRRKSVKPAEDVRWIYELESIMLEMAFIF